MVDAIIEYIRIAKTGVPSVELAERFLKFKNPPVKFAHAAICGIIAGDKRCLFTADGFWVYDESRENTETALDKLPLCVVYILTDSQREKIDYVSVWNVFPYPEFCVDAWLHIPSATLAGIDLSGNVLTTDSIEIRLAQIISILSEKVPVLLSSDDVHLFNAQFENDVLTDKNQRIVFSDILGALSIDIPDNYSLAQVSKIFNNHRLAESPPEQAKFFAAIVSDAIKMLNEKNVFTKKEFDHTVMQTTELMISGKQFSLQQIRDLPEAPGVYGLKNIMGKYLFISKCKDLQVSICSHFQKYSNPVKKRIAEESVCFDAHRCGSDLECELFEYRLINKYNPVFRETRAPGSSDIPGNCILFLPHAEQSRVLTVWVFEKRKVVMKSFRGDIEIPLSVDTELGDYFYTCSETDQSDPYERSIIGGYLKKNPDIRLLMVSSSSASTDLIKEFKERIRKFVEN